MGPSWRLTYMAPRNTCVESTSSRNYSDHESRASNIVEIGGRNCRIQRLLGASYHLGSTRTFRIFMRFSGGSAWTPPRVYGGSTIALYTPLTNVDPGVIACVDYFGPLRLASCGITCILIVHRLRQSPQEHARRDQSPNRPPIITSLGV